MRTQTLAALYKETFSEHWNDLAFSDYGGSDFTYRDVAKIISSLQLFYEKMGLQPGDKVAVIGRNSAHWGAVFLSAIASSLVIVPVLPDFNVSDTNHIVNHSESKIVIAAKNQIDKIDMEHCPQLEALLVLEDFSLQAARDGETGFSLTDAFEHFRKNELKPEAFRFDEVERDTVCVISYTSGTSGFTKGVLIPERSLVSNIVYAREHMPLKPGHKIVSFLPMAHVYGLLFEFLFPLSLGCHITFLSKMPTPAIITKVFGEVRPHLILSVPLIIEKIYKNRIQPTLEKPLVKALLKIPGLSFFILRKIRAALVDTFGGRFFEIVIGGAPLNPEVEAFFRKIKFPLTVGYGMTECGPLISYEAWNKTRQGSAGRLVDRMEMRIDSEDPFKVVGEIQVRGDNVMLGYYKNETDTQAAFTEDGWLKTGDLGLTDEQQFIYIKGRSKNMLLGPSGQNIYPEELESRLTAQPYVAECVVVDRDHKLVALVYPDFDALKADGVSTDKLPAIMDENRKKVNSELPKYEQISRVELVDEEFEKTPKKNIKRYKYA